MAVLDPYAAIDEYALSVIKAPPTISIDINSISSTTLTNQNLIGNVFQFSYRYVYDDEEKSVWSVPSYVEYGINGSHNIYDIVRGDNFDESIVMELRLYITPTNVDKIEIAFRMNGGLWQLYDTIEDLPVAPGFIDYEFANDRIPYPLPDGDVLRPYDYVPQLAGAQELINKNIVCYGDIYEGLTNPATLNVTLEPRVVYNETFHDNIISGVYSPYDEDNVIINARITRVHFWGDEVRTIDIDFVAANDIYANMVVYLIANNTFHTVVYNNVVDYQADQATEFAAIIQEDSMVSTAVAIGTTIRVTFHNDMWDVGAFGMAYRNYQEVLSVKDHAKYYVGIEYLDMFGRVGFVATDDSMVVDVPSLGSQGLAYTDYRSYIYYTIAHVPPIWAHTYRFCYATNINWWMPYLIRPRHDDDRSVFRDEEKGLIKIKINEGPNNVRDVLRNYELPNYSFTKGDRIRIIGTVPIYEDDLAHFPVDVIDTSVAMTTSTTTPGFTEEYEEMDFEILDFDGIYIYISDFTQDERFSGIAPDIDSVDADDIYAEIYRIEKETDNLIYKSVSWSYSITNPGKSNRVHGTPAGILFNWNAELHMVPVAYLGPEELVTSSTTTTSTSTSTTVTSAYVPTYVPGLKCIVALLPYAGHKIPVTRNQLWDSKINVVNEAACSRRVNKLRWGGEYIDDSNINNLCRFLYDDEKRMPDKYGIIHGLSEIGYTLKVLQRSKNTSIYIGREMALDASGNEQMVYTNNVLGSKSPAVEEFGTVHPDSIVVSDRYLYYFDINSGRIIRDAPTGR